MSPQMKSGFDPMSDDEALETFRAKSGGIDLDLTHSARMDRAKRKLESVLVCTLLVNIMKLIKFFDIAIQYS
jgi:hypothetical protein